MTKAWIFPNYVASQLNSLFSCRKLVTSCFTIQYFLKKFRTFPNILEIKQLQCTTVNISDWLAKSGKFLNHFAWLLKTWIFCHDPGITSITLHHCQKKIVFLAKLWSFFIYATSLLKNWFAAKLPEIFELPCIIVKKSILCQNLRVFLMYNASVVEFLLLADIFEFLGLHWIANKLMDILPKP